MTLTPRESDVYRLLLTGKPSPQCAAAVGITLGTFKVYSSRVYQKFGVTGRLDLCRHHGLNSTAPPLARNPLVMCAESFREPDYTFA